MASFKARNERTTNPLFDADRVVREPRLDQLGTMNFQEPGQGYTEPRQYLATSISWNACKSLLLFIKDNTLAIGDTKGLAEKWECSCAVYGGVTPGTTR